MSEIPLEEHYKTLDASPTASWKEIRILYRDLAQVWHPDRFTENERLREKAETKLKAINHAYEVLRKSLRSGEAPPPEKKAARPATPPRPEPEPAATEVDIPAEESEALGWYARAATEGHADAQCIIATMYAEGQLVPRDEFKALEWFRRSAAQGHPAALFQVGLRYYSGGGVPKDPKKAFDCYLGAALQDHAKAQFSLGIMYTNGVHIEKDDLTAHAWFTIAAKNGHPDAPTLRDSIAGLLDQDQLVAAAKKASQLRRRIATEN